MADVPEENPLDLLQSGRMPKMVGWYDPRLLARIGVRTIISNVFGQYADRRLLHAATDQVSEDELVHRYDFTDAARHGDLALAQDATTGTFWLDYIADTGDGFDNTLAMAYLLAKDELAVGGVAAPLKHGDILIMGGDQCYPQATRDEYKKRLTTPFNWAFSTPKATRKLFAIPGNHDWYDGIEAFGSLFCSSRDRLAGSHPTTIGGWRCMQHRSYWAMKLPHDWWIWGADIQFSKFLDASQISYFKTVAQQMKPGDNLIICMAEPQWMIADSQEKDEEQNLYQIAQIAQSAGVVIRAAIAGDWHHYNRYNDDKLGVEFITAGGGGAFMHPTHVLKSTIKVSWPERKTEIAPDGNEAGGAGAWKPQPFDVSLKNKPRAVGGVIGDVAEVVRDAIEPIESVSATKKAAPKPVALSRLDSICYPDKTKSFLLGFRNIAFPLYNKWFAFGIGFIYFMITWQFYNIVERDDISAGRIDAVSSLSDWFSTYVSLPIYLLQALLVSIALALMLLTLCVVLYMYVDAVEKRGIKRTLTKLSVGGMHALAHIMVMFGVGFLFVMINNWIAPPIVARVEALQVAVSSADKAGGSAVWQRMARRLLEPLKEERLMERKASGRPIGGYVRRGPPPAPAAGERRTEEKTALAQEVRKIIGLVAYPLEMTILGGLAGGFVWGLYWLITGALFGMHAEQAFAALRIKDYKNFLRFKFEPGRLTIYPIGIDRMPRARDWTLPGKGRPVPNHNPKLVPVGDIPLRLIEAPIVFETGPKVG